MEIFGYVVPTGLLVVALCVVILIYVFVLPSTPDTYRPDTFNQNENGYVEVGEISTGLKTIDGHLYKIKPDSKTTCYIVSIEDEGTGISCMYDLEDYPR